MNTAPHAAVPDFAKGRLRRDRGLAEFALDTAFDTSVPAPFNYLFEVEQSCLLRVTNNPSVSQVLIGALGTFSMAIVDGSGSPLLILSQEHAGLVPPLVMRDPVTQMVLGTLAADKSCAIQVTDTTGAPLLSTSRSGLLYPTYKCMYMGRHVATVDEKFNGAAAIFNKVTAFEVSIHDPSIPPLQRLCVVAVGVYVDVHFNAR